MVQADYSDLEREYWYRMRNSGELVWRTKDGKNIPVKDLSDEHLVNILKFLIRQSDEEELTFDINGE